MRKGDMHETKNVINEIFNQCNCGIGGILNWVQSLKTYQFLSYK